MTEKIIIESILRSYLAHFPTTRQNQLYHSWQMLGYYQTPALLRILQHPQAIYSVLNSLYSKYIFPNSNLNLPCCNVIPQLFLPSSRKMKPVYSTSLCGRVLHSSGPREKMAAIFTFLDETPLVHSIFSHQLYFSRSLIIIFPFLFNQTSFLQQSAPQIDTVVQQRS